MAEDKKFSWDDEVTAPEKESFTALPEGDYLFQVEEFEKKYYQPKEPVTADSLPACNMAAVKIRVENPNGKDITIIERFYLLESRIRKIEAFFVSLGLMQAGEKVRMKLFQKAIDESGWCHIIQREYNGKTYNNVQYWLAPDEAKKAAEAKKTEAKKDELLPDTLDINGDDLPF